MTESKHVLLFIYNSFSDPIVQGSVLRYIKRYKEESGGSAKFSLITFEQAQYELSDGQKQAAIKELSSLEITWYPLVYHTGGKLILFKKLFDLVRGFWRAFQIKSTVGVDLIYTVGTIAGSMGFVLSRLLNVQLLVHTYEPHSAFMADFGYWSRGGVSFRLLRWFEKIVGNSAAYIMASTHRMREELRESGSKAIVFQVPSCVDLKKFIRNEEQRQLIRDRMGLNNRNVLLYLGKFGGIYLEDVAFDCFKTYLGLKDTGFKPYVLILTSNDHQEVESQMLKRGISPADFCVSKVPFEEVQNYISASDAGFTGIPGLPSQAYRSPIKNGEYWACGLPIWIMKGVGEDYLIAEKENVGVLIEDSGPEIIENSALKLKALLKTSDEALVQKCVNVARNYRDIAQTDRYYLEAFGDL